MLKFFCRLKRKKSLVLVSVPGKGKTNSNITLVKKPKIIGDLIMLHMNR